MSVDAYEPYDFANRRHIGPWRCHVNFGVGDCAGYRHDDRAADQLQTPPLSAADHRPCRLAVFSISSQPEAGRRIAARAGDRRLLRNRSALGDEIWSGLCSPAETKETWPARYLASRRSRHHDQWRKALSLARRRSRRIRAGRDRPDPPQHPGSQAIVGAAFAQARLSSQTHDHRQTRLLRRRPAQDHAESRASSAQGSQQSRRKLARSHSQTRAGDARFSIMERTSKIRRNLLRRPQSLRSTLDHTAPHSPPICIASRRWRSGNPSHVQSREISGAGLFTTSAC